MLPASNRGVGMNMGFPDVCLTPAAPVPIPIPYPNLAMHAQAVPFAVKVMLSMMNGLNMGSKIPMTMGDEGGSAHPLFKQMGQFTMGNPKVLLEGLPAISLTCPTTGNMMNNPIGLVSVPAATNVFFTYRHDRPLDVDAVAALASAVTRQEAKAQADGDVLVLRPEVIARDLPARLHGELRELPAALVVDLRGCRGGSLHAALEVAADFLPEGALVATVIDDEGDAVPHLSRGPQAYSMPVVVAVDEDTASAAEIIAASLRAHGRAEIVGRRTYGKPAAASLVAGTFRRRGTVKVQGESLVGGLTPDHVVEGDVLAAARARAEVLGHSRGCDAPSPHRV